MQNQIAAFDEYVLDLGSKRLTKGGELVPLTNVPAKVLAALITRHGQQVSYAELTGEVWPEHRGRPRDRNLQVAVSELRTALGWKEAYPIRTIPTIGYQFVAAVTWLPRNPGTSVSGTAGVAVQLQPAPAEPIAVSRPVDTAITSAMGSRTYGKTWILTFLGVALAVGLAVAMLVWARRPSNPHHLRLDGQTLVALAQDETEVWRFSLERKIVEVIASPEHGWLVADIDGDGRNETFFYVYEPNGDTVLYCLGPNGKVRWKRPAGRPFQPHEGKLPDRTQYIGNILAALKTPRVDGATLIAGARSLAGFGQQVAALRPDGTISAAYWHPGWFSRLCFVDLDGDGQDEILLGGVNNSFLNQTGPWDDLKRGSSGGTLVVLDRNFPTSQGRTKEKGDPWTWDDLPQGLERDVLIFNSPTHVSDEEYYRVIDILPGDNRLEVLVAQLQGKVHYSLDKQLHFVSALASSGLPETAMLEVAKPKPRSSAELPAAIDRVAKSKMWRLTRDEGVWVRTSAAQAVRGN